MTDQPESRYTFDRVVRLSLTVAALAGIFLLTKFLSDVLIPFAAAVVLAYLLNPLVCWLERKTKRRGLAVAATLALLGIVATLAVAIVVPLMAGQIQRVRDDVLRLRDEMAHAANVAAATAPSAPPTADEKPAAQSTLGWSEMQRAWDAYRGGAGTIPRAQRLTEFRKALTGTYLGDLLDELVRYSRSEEFREFLVNLAKNVAVGGWTVVSFALSVILGVTGMVIVLVYLVFLLLDFPEYSRTWPTFLPPQYREPTVDFLTQFDTAMRRYFRGQAIVALLTGAMLTLGFTLIGLPMAVPFGVLVGILSMIPYLPAVAVIPGVMLAALRAIETDAGFLGSVVWLLLVFGVVQVIQDTLITPRVMGQATGLRPIAILLGVFIWGKLLGFLGLILSIPLTCLAIAYYRRFVLLHAAQPGENLRPPTKEGSP